jgi:glycosyltransferase involved in cell wall biosynthesis
VSEADLPRYYRLADVTVLPSTTMGEAFGLVLVESLASGTPVVASNLPGVRTVITLGAQGDGMLVEPRNPTALAAALRQILSDEHTRRAMGQRGRAKVEIGYDWTHIGAQLEQIYQRVLAERAIYAAIDIR